VGEEEEEEEEDEKEKLAMEGVAPTAPRPQNAPCLLEPE